MVAEGPRLAAPARQTDLATLMAISDALAVLCVVGPGLGRPLADRVAHSSLHNLKELRPGGFRIGRVRILFVFDPRRRAVLLVAGDKAGQWKRWYNEGIRWLSSAMRRT